LQTLHLEPIFYFFSGQTLNLKPIIFFLNGQTLNLEPFAAEICEPVDLEPQTLNLKMSDFPFFFFNRTAEQADSSPP
jgi:hypothetical protein